jgi:hypothetical protein
MAQRQHLHDRYGRPLPELTDAEQEILYGRRANGVERQRLHALLEEECHALLRRHVSAEVTLSFVIVEGMIQPKMTVETRRHYRRRPEEE